MDLLTTSVATPESDTEPYTLVALDGEADVTNCNALREVLEAEVAKQPSTLIIDPQAGQRRPGPDATGGHGLWLVYQVCDLVEVRSDETGTTIRMHMGI